MWTSSLIQRHASACRLTVTCSAALFLSAAGMALSTVPARTQDATGWPSRPITAVVGFAAGGNSDAMARIAAQKLSERLGQNVVIDNRPGAGGALGAGFVARSAPDGNTLMFAASPTIGVVPRLQKVTYDPLNDFEPISSFGSGPYILAIRSEIPATTVREFVEYAKKNSFTYGSGGVGTISHLTSALFFSKAKVQGVHVPFRGGGLTMTALIGGQLDVYFANASELIAHADDKRITILGVTGQRRLKRLPDVPTISEAYSEANMPATGLPSWNGLFAPRGTPKTVIEQLSKHMMAIAREPAVVEQLERIGIVAEGTSAAEFSARIKSDLAIFDDAIDAAGIPRAQ